MEPSSSEQIIASLISEVKNSNAPFDVKILIGGRENVVNTNGNELSISRSGSVTPTQEEKEKRHKSKKSKKSKRKHGSSELSRKKQRRSCDNSSSAEGANKESLSIDRRISPNSLDLEAHMEKISDDDELPVGADFQSVSGCSERQASGSRLPKVDEFSSGTGRYKRREFDRNEEVFPLSKNIERKNRSESFPVVERTLSGSEVLAKVRTDKNSPLVPRKIKLKQDVAKNAASSGAASGDVECRGIANDPVCSAVFGRARTSEVESEEYGPKLAVAAPPPGQLPISDDEEDVFQLNPPVLNIQLPKTDTIKIGSIRGSMITDLRKNRVEIGEDGEIPVSDDDSSASGSEVGKRRKVGSDSGKAVRSDKTRARDQHLKDVAESAQAEHKQSHRDSKHERKRKKEKKKSKKEKNRRQRQASSSSDSEKEWKQLENSKPAISKVEKGSAEYGKEKKKITGERSDRTSRRNTESSSKDIHERHRRRSRSSHGIRSRRSHNQREGSAGSHKEGGRRVSTLRRPNGRRSFRSLRSPFSPGRWRRPRFWSPSRSRSASSSSSRRSHRSRSHREKRHIPEKDRSVDEKVDKKKLLEIAQRNAAQMAQLGYLPNSQSGAQLKPGGAQSIDQLVDFCQKLQRSQDKAERREMGEEVSSDEEEMLLSKKNKEEGDFLKHPFALKPAAPITINITNLRPTPIKAAPDPDDQLCISYPVSSGREHRDWRPVEKPEEDKASSVSKGKSNEQIAGKSSESRSSSNASAGSFSLPLPPKPPVLLASFAGGPSALLNLPPPPPPPMLFSPTAAMDVDSAMSNMESSSYFAYPDQMAMSSEMLTQELQFIGTPPEWFDPEAIAKQRLARNPNDLEAALLLKNPNHPTGDWLPTQSNRSVSDAVVGSDDDGDEYVFVGPTLPRRLSQLPQLADKVTGVGMKLMQKMGWTPGEGLGKDRDGPLEPLSLKLKLDRKGLVAPGEHLLPKSLSSIRVMAGKHPVSALMELCSKRRWQCTFDCMELGPPNARRYLWNISVNSVMYQQRLSSSNKKEGKAQTCQMILEILGVVPQKSASYATF